MIIEILTAIIVLIAAGVLVKNLIEDHRNGSTPKRKDKIFPKL